MKKRTSPFKWKWDSYKNKALSSKHTKAQIDASERAFYAGALSLYVVLTKEIIKQDNNIALQEIAELKHELLEKMKQFIIEEC